MLIPEKTKQSSKNSELPKISSATSKDNVIHEANGESNGKVKLS